MVRFLKCVEEIGVNHVFLFLLLMSGACVRFRGNDGLLCCVIWQAAMHGWCCDTFSTVISEGEQKKKNAVKNMTATLLFLLCVCFWFEPVPLYHSATAVCFNSDDRNSD